MTTAEVVGAVAGFSAFALLAIAALVVTLRCVDAREARDAEAGGASELADARSRLSSSTNVRAKA